jgi:LmbE family N-acetylglucosaminyl deacetylase
MTADGWAARLAGGERIVEPIAIIVAHADDETLFAGALLGRADDALLIHVTDSAPHDMTDAYRLGFATRAAYAAARAGEVDAALAALDAWPRRIEHGVPDQDAAWRIAAIADRLVGELAGVAMVATHAYEGGHPDHDAVACAVRLAVDRLDPAPALVEFPSYHLRGDARIWAEFWPAPAHPEHGRTLTPTDAARIDAALVAHASQAGVFEDWRPSVERWRAAPVHDFTTPPPPGACLYDRFGWAITSAHWRQAAAEAIAYSAGSGTSRQGGG